MMASVFQAADSSLQALSLTGGSDVSCHSSSAKLRWGQTKQLPQVSYTAKEPCGDKCWATELWKHSSTLSHPDVCAALTHILFGFMTANLMVIVI